MQNAYHAEAEFYDPVFQDLSARETKAMWQMLVTTAKDLQVFSSHVFANDKNGTCQWEAVYTFTATGKKVHNIIQAGFDFKEGKIIKHRDHFDLWKWSSMAFGLTGTLLGWSSLLKNKIRKTAKGRLIKFMNQNA